MKTTELIIILLFAGLAGCQQPDKKMIPQSNTPAEKVERELASKQDSYLSRNEYMVLATLYHQQAAEYQAQCYQAYNIGKMMLDKDLADKSVDKHRIVVLDVDETVLDNSPYEAACILQGINYPTRWDEWCNKASAKAIPGALEFLNYARANGVSVFYVTNRKDHLKQATINNLQKLNFPHADDEHVITRSKENSKEGRRNTLEEKYHIALLFGDNLSDFNFVFDDKSNQERSNEVERLSKQFGSRFIILPNAAYGDWEVNLYKNYSSPDDSLKAIIRYKALTAF